MKEAAQSERASLLRQARQDMRRRLETLASSVDQVAADEGFRALLTGMSRLWRYGPYNQYLIWRVRPHATAVAGRRQWEKMGRRLRAGASPIQILAPRTRGGLGYPFIVVEVFDIADTIGPPPPPLKRFNGVRGECERLPAVEAAAGRLRIELEYVSAFPNEWGDDTSVLGTAHPAVRKVRIRRSLTPLERARTLIHEYAHVLLLQPHPPRGKSKGRRPPERPSRAIAEAEAEATAFLVFDVLGLPSNAPTYIAWMGGDGSMISASVRRIQAAGRAILLAIEGETPIIRIPRLPGPQGSKTAARGRVAGGRVGRSA